ncbi:MAG: PQQ-binding-like beta-propeller repeat protein [Planctomycetota bacterium]
MKWNSRPRAGISLIAVILLLLGIMSASGADRWPQFRGPNGDGHAGNADVPLQWSETENIAWKTSIHDRGWSSPVVWSDRIWMTTATPDGREMFAICLDLKTGRVIHDKKIFEVDEPNEIHSLNSYASPTPVVEAGRVYVHFGTYGTACLDTETAQVLWSRRDLNCDHYRGPGSSPVVHGDLLYLHYDGFDVQYVVALDKHTGETAWRTDRSTEFRNVDGDFHKAYSTPILIEVSGQLQLFSPGSQAAMAYDPATGRELWKVRHSGFSSTARPLYGHGLVFFQTGFGRSKVLAVRPDGHGDVSDTHVVWRVSRAVPAKPSSILVGTRLYMVDDQGVGTCLEAESGETVWRERLRGDYSASPILAAGRLYFFNQQGQATVIHPGREFQVLATNELDTGCMASPAVVGDCLIVRTETDLYRIEDQSETASRKDPGRDR